MSINRIQSYEQKIAANPYRKIGVQTVQSRSHEFSSQGWDVLRAIESQDVKGNFITQWLMAPASCLVLMAGLPASHVERGGRVPFAYGNVYSTPRNLVLIREFVADGTFGFGSDEDQDRFDSECAKYSVEMAEIASALFPEREVAAKVAVEAAVTVAKKAKKAVEVASEVTSEIVEG